MTSREDLTRLVERRANDRCEYGGMHQSLQGATFHLEHILPISRGGLTELDNLAWACPQCNLHKSHRIEARDLESGLVVPLFHPRVETWQEHFRFDGYEIRGRTAVGRATAAAFDLNHVRRLRVRQAEQLFGLFPPWPA